MYVYKRISGEKSPTVLVVALGLWGFSRINYTLGKAVPVTTGRQGP
jgi:hypothetical protein